MKLAFFWLWLFCSAVWAGAQPAQIILIRHAEKPKDPRALHLSKKGEERANALPEFFKRDNKAMRYGAPVALFASRPTRHGRGQRPGETLAPLAKTLGLPIQTPYESEDFDKLARVILNNTEFKGKTVVICWVHEFMHQFAADLGVKPEPSPWKDQVYDRAYLITFESGQPELDVVNLKLLPGDSKYKEKD